MPSDCNLAIAHITGNFYAIDLLHQSVRFLKDYYREQNMDSKYETCLLCIIKNYKDLLKNRGLCEDNVWVDYYGYNGITLQEIKGIDDSTSKASIAFGYRGQDRGKEFWQLICDILDLKIQVVHQNISPEYNYTVERQENLADVGIMIKDGSFRRMHNFACFKVMRDGEIRLRVRDLYNPKCTADFIWDDKKEKFDLWYNSFKEDKRMYEMLYLVERNDAEIWSELQDESLRALNM